ncbi:hypothetical protein [Ileibacterium valens]|uniref:hypothetical protein n=1 Tax=Ileibacterium valens TaxID=1862668 RepID=UPI0024B98933|nr:hypothetical protein [Ileibacterium valens]
MNKKFKRAGATLALLLVGAAGAAGSLAYLQTTSGEVVNTFTAESNIVDDANSNFQLKESAATSQPNGNWTIATDAALDQSSVNYTNVIPGTTLDKNPTVILKDLNVQSYLFIKQTETPNEALDYSVDRTKWTPVEGETNVWYYSGTDATNGVLSQIDATKDQAKTFSILTNNEVTVGNFADGTDLGKLTFNSYLVQAAGFDTAEEAWTAAGFND